MSNAHPGPCKVPAVPIAQLAAVRKPAVALIPLQPPVHMRETAVLYLVVHKSHDTTHFGWNEHFGSTIRQVEGWESFCELTLETRLGCTHAAL